MAQILQVLEKIEQTNCPEFTTSENWTQGRGLLKACLWAVVGQLASKVLCFFIAFAINNRIDITTYNLFNMVW